MTALGERMIEDLQLHGLAEKTQEAYLHLAWEKSWPAYLFLHYGEPGAKTRQQPCSPGGSYYLSP